jgi:glycosyltransferase involved in cell wall biosynthesis
MKIQFLIQGREVPSSRDRVLQYLPFLNQHGFVCEIWELNPKRMRGGKLGKLLYFLKFFFRLPRTDVVFIQKHGFLFYRWLIVRLIFALRKTVFFDFDDAIYFLPEGNNYVQKKYLKRIQFVLIRSSLVIPGNEYLRQFAEQYTKSVFLAPTAVNVEKYSPPKHSRDSRLVTIGWIGSEPNIKHLSLVSKAVQEVVNENNKVRFLVVCNVDQKPEMFRNHQRIEFKKWNAHEEVSDLRSFDIGIMPLTDDLFSKGKCGFKLLQYMAVGIPVVASPVGVNSEIVVHEANGFLAKNSAEWKQYLNELCLDRSLRIQMGEMGRKSVVEKYSVQFWSRQLIDQFSKWCV